MNLQQLKYVCAVVDHGLNVSDAAEALYTSQPGISKQIRQLEDELGLRVFVRQGKRLASLTPAGEIVIATARRALREIGNLKRVADEFRAEDGGTLSIATTHTQARYVLPKVLSAFAARYPKVKVVLHQGNPQQVAVQIADGDADIGIATEALADYPDLVSLPCYTWNRCVLVPKGHPLAKAKGKLTLEALAKWPIVTYDFSFTGRSQINAAFAARGLEPNVVLTALDADVIKTYVELGMGVGIVAQMAFDPLKDGAFEKLDASHLFAPSTTRVALRRGVFVRGYLYAFIALFAPKYTRTAVDAALAGHPPAHLECRDDRRHALFAKRSWTLATLLATLAMLGPFSIDMYLPAFPAIAQDFGVASLAVQQTLSVYLFAYAAMMLWHGALADALGRRPVVLAGLGLYALATLGCAISGNIESLWLFRMLQGISAGTGLVVGRAVIRDRFHGAEAQRLMSQITLVFGIAPAVAPVIGGALLNTFGWRSIFWVLFAWVLATLVWTARTLPETLAPEHRQRLHPRTQWRNYKSVVTRPEFLLLAFIPSCNFSAFFIYVAVAPAFLVGHLGVSTWGFGWLFLPLIAGVLTGATISGRVAGRWSPRQTVGVAFAFMAGAAAFNLGICALAPRGVAWYVAPLFFYTLGSSLAMPSVTLLLLDLFPSMRGLASSLQGFVQFAFAGIVAGSIAPALDGTLLRMALGMAAFMVASYLLWLAYQRYTSPLKSG